MIWFLIQKSVGVLKIRYTLPDEFDIDEETCEKDLLSLLITMKQEGLVDIEDPVTS